MNYLINYAIILLWKLTSNYSLRSTIKTESCLRIYDEFCSSVPVFKITTTNNRLVVVVYLSSIHKFQNCILCHRLHFARRNCMTHSTSTFWFPFSIFHFNVQKTKRKKRRQARLGYYTVFLYIYPSIHRIAFLIRKLPQCSPAISWWDLHLSWESRPEYGVSWAYNVEITMFKVEQRPSYLALLAVIFLCFEFGICVWVWVNV